MSGVGTGVAIAGGISAAAGIGGAALAAHGASKAADTQAQAATTAAQYQYQASQDALNFQKQQYATSQQELQPWLKSGGNALSALNYGLGLGTPGGSAAQSTMNGINPVQAGSAGNPTGPSPGAPFQARIQPGAVTAPPGQGQIGQSIIPTGASTVPGTGATGTTATGSTVSAADPQASGVGYGSLMTPYGQTFSAPTDLTMQNDPGYQARLKLGTDALQHSAAARGSVLTGGTAQALDQYAQDYASNEYGNVYNRAYNTFSSNYNQYNQDQANQYNKLASLAGLGQQTASTMGVLGQNSANSMANTVTQGAAAVNQQNNNAAAATASGYAANGNIWGNALSGLGNNLSNLYQLQNSSSGNPYQTLYNAQNPDRSSIQPTYAY
jgi:hypothetical protein